MNSKTVEAITMYGLRKTILVEELIFRPSAYLVVIDDGKVLLLKHKKTNKLGLPGGGIELGESISEALLRELQEELGTNNIKVGNLIGVAENFLYYDDSDEAYHALLFFYDGQVNDLSEISASSGLDDVETDPRWYEIRELTEDHFGELKTNSFLSIIQKAQN